LGLVDHFLLIDSIWLSSRTQMMIDVSPSGPLFLCTFPATPG
jgi:hypothetical protein